MKRLLIGLLALTSMYASDITFTKKFEKKVLPDTLSLQFSINVNKPYEKLVIAKLNYYYKNIIKDSKLKIEGGNFNVNPNYRYHNNKRILDGYRGSVSYVVKSKSKDKIDSFLKTLYDTKEEPMVNISVGNIRWIVDDTQFASISDGLRAEAIIWGYGYIKELSSLTSSECSLETLNINAPHFTPRPPVRHMMAKGVAMMEDASFAPTPQQTNTPFSINPTFVMECK